MFLLIIMCISTDGYTTVLGTHLSYLGGLSRTVSQVLLDVSCQWEREQSP